MDRAGSQAREQVAQVHNHRGMLVTHTHLQERKACQAVRAFLHEEKEEQQGDQDSREENGEHHLGDADIRDRIQS